MTEHPAAPTTTEGKRLIALLAEYQVIADSDYPDKERRTAATEAYRDARETVRGLLPLIEAEAQAAGYRDCAIRTLEAIRRDRNIPEGDPLLTILVPDSLSTDTREEPSDE